MFYPEKCAYFHRYDPSEREKGSEAIRNIHFRGIPRDAFGAQGPGCFSVMTTKSVTDQVLIFLLNSSLLPSRVARAILPPRALI